MITGRFEGVFSKPVSASYLISEPSGEGPHPLLLFLHGFGERGDDLEAVKRHGPPKEAAAGRQFPFLLVAPQLPESQTSWDVDTLLSLLDQIEASYAVDKERIYVTGMSMGGYGTWAVACAAPGRFAAIAPICGGGTYLAAFQLAQMPIWAIHGDADDAVPVSESQIMIDAVRRGGGSPRFDVIKGGTHDVWTNAYVGNEIYDWLLSHTK